MKRRPLLAAVGTGLASFAGCLASGDHPDSDPSTQSSTKSPEDTAETNDDASPLTDWERSTDCEGEYDGMHDSVVSVARVRTELGDGYAPVEFPELSTEEKAIVRTVTEAGGYGTCDTTTAFDRFVDRVVSHRERQDEGMDVYLERDGTYYGLYVEVQDQVYAY